MNAADIIFAIVGSIVAVCIILWLIDIIWKEKE